MSAPNPSAGEPYTATWRLSAACRGMDTALFYPTRGTSKIATAAVRAVCEGCPVRAQCLDEAVDTFEVHGIWGGLFSKERRAIRRTDAA